MNRREAVCLAVIILLAVLFRFYRFGELQYWSADDEIFAAVVTRMIFQPTVTLVSPNATLGLSLGSFLHLLSVPVYWLAGLNPAKIGLAGSTLGIATTVLIYLTGREINGWRVGFLAAFLYAVSFLAGFTDRRWWPLSLDPFLATLAIFSAEKIAVRKDSRYFLTLMVAVSFAWHADPTLAVVGVFAVLVWVVFKLPLFKKSYLPGLVYLAISVLPLVFFEWRHPGAISQPISQFLAVRHAGEFHPTAVLVTFLDGTARGLFVTPSQTVEKYLLYCRACQPLAFGGWAELVTLGLLALPIMVARSKSKILYLFLAAFLIGAAVHTGSAGQFIYQHFFMVIWPATFLLLALTLNWLWQKRLTLLVASFLGLVLVVNLQALFFSRMKYPLKDKMAAADYALAQVDDSPFALEQNTDNHYLDGFGGLFFLRRRYPANADYYRVWDWIFRAYSLYGTEITAGSLPKTVIIGPAGSFNGKVFGNIAVEVRE
jgi:hypothetical protein